MTARCMILVCGGRNYADKKTLFAFLDEQHSICGFSHVIHGYASGADSLAHEWALSRSVQPVACEANWPKIGRRAGPVRNAAMLKLMPDWACATPGGVGTAHMVQLLKAAGIPVLLLSEEK